MVTNGIKGRGMTTQLVAQGAIIAALYVVLSSGLNMVGLSTQAQQLVQGVVFLVFVAVFADRESLRVIK